MTDVAETRVEVVIDDHEFWVELTRFYGFTVESVGTCDHCDGLHAHIRIANVEMSVGSHELFYNPATDERGQEVIGEAIRHLAIQEIARRN